MMEKRLLAIGDGCRLAWRFEGPVDAPVLLLSNSLGTTMEMWAPQIAVWARRFNVLRYDSRGHGDSDAPAGAYSMDRLGRDAVELLDGLGLDRAHFCGLSQGGMVGNGSPFTRRTASIGSCSPTLPPIWDRRPDGRRESTLYA